ncbi:isoprenylcysteine carboxylmethyltransferase family protein [Microvirga sp. CF3062]|uniref:methyltransferase family protein n=1 Tax=Microvirga sp. CF3062 TaxID=3110182 RepID=UPI002E776661|nr:isoprenylcysteine carboxylmethyltransferase family protein [Microvirga sp. CF3062]MEE1657888.1 isoprenylcysteine carboxylmethyltransferase family protein [Microvirga sp. CF3062]
MMPPAIVPVLLLVGLGAAFAVLTRRVSQRLGRSADRFGRGDTAHDFVGRVYRVGGSVLFLFMMARVAIPEADGLAGLIPGLTRPLLAWSGLAIMVGGSAIILISQVQMGTSWRIGLDQDRTGLVTTGLFAWSRNPTFLGMLVVVSGVFLVAPTAVTASVVTVAWISFSVQIRMEEEHLLRMHGADYERYRDAVPRWILPRGILGAARVERDQSVNPG